MEKLWVNLGFGFFFFFFPLVFPFSLYYSLVSLQVVAAVHRMCFGMLSL